MKQTTKSNSAEQTKLIAEQIARNFKGGEVVELVSDLGGGKTTFVHGLAKGIKSKDKVASPTFTVSKLYQGEKLTIHHFDFYRLDEPGLIKHYIDDVLSDPSSVVVIEWPGIMANLLPEEVVRIEFLPASEDERMLVFNSPKSLEYLFSNVDINH